MLCLRAAKVKQTEVRIKKERSHSNEWNFRGQVKQSEAGHGRNRICPAGAQRWKIYFQLRKGPWICGGVHTVDSNDGKGLLVHRSDFPLLCGNRRASLGQVLVSLLNEMHSPSCSTQQFKVDEKDEWQVGSSGSGTNKDAYVPVPNGPYLQHCVYQLAVVSGPVMAQTLYHNGVRWSHRWKYPGWRWFGSGEQKSGTGGGMNLGSKGACPILSFLLGCRSKKADVGLRLADIYVVYRDLTRVLLTSHWPSDFPLPQHATCTLLARLQSRRCGSQIGLITIQVFQTNANH